ncbi:MAG: PQQ-binding-like beta-propeller repeat protein [Vicinamibacterales bacterium]
MSWTTGMPVHPEPTPGMNPSSLPRKDLRELAVLSAVCVISTIVFVPPLAGVTRPAPLAPAVRARAPLPASTAAATAMPVTRVATRNLAVASRLPVASPIAPNGLLFVGTGSQGDANRPFLAVRPGAAGDITLAADATSNAFIAWSHPRASGYTPSALAHDGRVYLVHDTGILLVLDAPTGREIYKARVGGAGNTFSASPTAAGRRIYLLNEEGVTFVLDAADKYTELSRNDLGEMSLASPAVAGGAIYIRTEKTLYKIGGE